MSEAKARAVLTAQPFIVPGVAAAVSLAAGILLLLLLGKSPLTVTAISLRTVLGSKAGFVDTVLQAVPLLLIALGYTLCFRAGLWNVGGEGQFHLGAVAAVWVALGAQGTRSAALGLPLAVVAAMVAGVLWALVPGWLRAARGVNEVVSSLMLNFVGIFVMSGLIRTTLRDPAAALFQSAMVGPAFQIPALGRTRLHWGVILAFALVVPVAYVAHRSTFGHRASAVGANPNGSRALGIDVPRTILVTFVISGALGGLAGAVHVLGVTHRLLSGLSHDFGYTAISVTLLARGGPIFVVPTAFLFSALTVASEAIQVELAVPSDFMLVLSNAFVLFVLAGSALRRHRWP